MGTLEPGGKSPAGSIQSTTGSTKQHPPTSVTTQETQGKATSPEDVRKQQAGQPTTGDQARGAVPGAGSGKQQASEALAKARSFDAQGQESQCMEQVRMAKTMAGQ